MRKIIEIEPYFPTGEASIQPVVLWANGRPCYESFTKYANVASDYFKTVTPIPGHSIVYVLALGSWETYGENRNGDGFPEHSYNAHMNPPWIREEDTLVRHYKTFETAHNFRHHRNSDPNKAVGRVLQAFWNPTMHRVELVVDLENSKAPDLAERIAAREFPPVSMGSRVPVDVCSICGNRAATRAQYCDHLKFQMRDVVNGKKVAALNPSPKFFDISWVFRPADATAFMLKKVAHDYPYEVISGAAAGEYLDRQDHRKVAAKKLAVIDKVIRGVPIDAKQEALDPAELAGMLAMRPCALDAGAKTPDLPDAMLSKLSQYSLPEIFSSAAASGMIQLSAPETLKLVLLKHASLDICDATLLSKVSAVQPAILELFGDYPQLLDQLDGAGALKVAAEYVRPALLQLFTPYIEKRAGIPEYLKRRFVPGDLRGASPSATEMYTLTDPGSGERYETSRAAAIRAHDEVAKRNLYKVIGGGALLAGGYKLMSSQLMRSGHGKLRPLAALGTGLVGASAIPSMGKHYVTDQGVPIPVNTELSKAAAATSIALPALGTLGIMAALSHDYRQRQQSGIPLGHPGLPAGRRGLDTLSDTAVNNPLASLAVGTIALNQLGKSKFGRGAASVARYLGTPVIATGKGLKQQAGSLLQRIRSGEKIAEVLPGLECTSYSAVQAPNLDLDKLAEWIGHVIVDG